MEIKVICGCGIKYAFEAEPVDGHMPQAVKCPSCGANGTAQANAVIREALGIAPPPETHSSVGQSCRSATPSASPVATPVPTPVPQPALRVSIPRPAPAPAVADAVHIGGIPAAGSSSGPRTQSVWAARGKKALALVGKGIAVLLCILAMLAGFGGKKGRGLRVLTRLALGVFRANKAAADDEEHEKQNLWGQDIVLLLIQHTNETEIAEACTSFWQDTYKKKISFVLTNDVAIEENQIGIIPAHNGCVQIVGGLKWPIEDFEKLTQTLSEKFQTVAVESRDVDFSGAYVFGVFERGEKKFRAEMQIKGDTLDNMHESVTVEGEQWAREHGFKGGKQRFKEFHLGDGDEITHQLGFKLWDREEWDKCLVMTELSAPLPPARVVPVRAVKSR